MKIQESEIAADVAGAESMQAQTRAVVTGVKPKETRCPIADLIFRDNVRGPSSYQLPQLIDSFRRNGYKPNNPIVVSVGGVSNGRDAGELLVLCGNRRGLAAKLLETQDVGTFAEIFPDGKIPAAVYSGLTLEQECLLRIDHGSDENRVPLDEFGEFLAVMQLVRFGYTTQAGIAAKLGKFVTDKTGEKQPARSWVQQRVNLAKLPQFVQNEMEKRCIDPDSSPLRWNMVQPLYTAFSAEYSAHPNGDGPKFLEVWHKAMTPAPASGAKTTIKADALIEVSKSVASRNLRDTLIAVANGKPVADVDSALLRAESAERILNEIAIHLGESKYNQLCKAAHKAAQAGEKTVAA